MKLNLTKRKGLDRQPAVLARRGWRSEICSGRPHHFRVHEDVLSGINRAFAASGIWPLTAVQFGSQVGTKNAQPRVAKMLTEAKTVLSAALVLSTAFSASAATKARLNHVHRPAIHDIVPDLSTSSSASADWSSNYAWCLLTDSSQECAFTSMAQCLASKHGNVDFCEPNNTYIGNTRSFHSRAW